VNDPERSEVVSLDDDRWIALEYGRRWPQYTLEWSVRQPAGDADFPIVQGRVEAMPPVDGDVEGLLADLRSRALTEAHSALVALPPAAPPPRRSLLSRLLGKK
jgi:hypothetical protein